MKAFAIAFACTAGLFVFGLLLHVLYDLITWAIGEIGLSILIWILVFLGCWWAARKDIREKGAAK